MTKYIDGIEFATEICCKCAMAFAMPADFQRRRRDDRQSFYCPSGHKQHYVGKTEAQLLREQLERAERERDASKSVANSAIHERDQIARAHKSMRNRVMNGVCPCCNRTFQNLLRHMQTEHQSEFSLRTLRQAFGMSQALLAKEIGVSQGHVSAVELGRSVTRSAQSAIDSWVESHKTREPA